MWRLAIPRQKARARAIRAVQGRRIGSRPVLVVIFFEPSHPLQLEERGPRTMRGRDGVDSCVHARIEHKYEHNLPIPQTTRSPKLYAAHKALSPSTRPIRSINPVCSMIVGGGMLAIFFGPVAAPPCTLPNKSIQRQGHTTALGGNARDFFVDYLSS